MRRAVDEATTHYYIVRVVMRVEEELGIIISDETLEAIRPLDDFTLQDLVTAVNRTSADVDLAKADEAVRSAACAEFPDAPHPLDFAAPLLSAISQRRHYGGP
jgi:hypothetical protein